MNQNSDPFAVLQDPAPSGIVPIETNEIKVELVAAITKKIDEFKSWRTPLWNTWEYLQLFLKGEQLIAKRTTDQSYLRIVTNEDVRQKYSIDNILHVASRAYVGKTTRAIPSVSVIPRTNDRQDQDAADIMDSFLDYIWRKERLKLKYKRAMDCHPWCGTAIFQPLWDPMQSPVAYCPECGYKSNQAIVGVDCPVCTQNKISIEEEYQQAMQMAQQAEGMGMQGMPMPQSPEEVTVPKLQKANEGDIVVKLWSAKEFLFDASASEVEDMEWCGVERILPISTIRKMWPEKQAMIAPSSDLYSDQYISIDSISGSASLRTKTLDNHARLFEIHTVPSGDFPNGAIIYMCNSVILEVKENIYHKLTGRLAFYPMRSDRRYGEFHGEALAWQAEGIQRERNKLLTQMRTHRDLTNNPKVLATTNSGINAKFMTDIPGEIVKHSDLSKAPEYMRLPEMPSYVWNEAERMKGSMREKFGVTEYDFGSSKSEQSGRFALTLEAQSNETIGPLMIECYEEFKEMHRAILLIGQHFMPEDRVWTIRGRDRYMSYSWKMADIRNGWDVALVEEDSLSKNPAVRQQQARQFLQDGVFTDTETGVVNMKRYMRMAGIRDPSVGPDMDGSERAYALAIPMLIEDALNGIGQMPTPRSYDDAKIMAEELLGWLRANRTHPDKRVIQAIEQMWIQYAMTLPPQSQATLGPAQQQQPQQQQGGAQPAVTESPTQELQGEVEQSIQNIDQAGEQQARANLPHEGATAQM